METVIPQTGLCMAAGSRAVCPGMGSLGCGVGWTPSPVCDAQCHCRCGYVACSIIQVLSLYLSATCKQVLRAVSLFCKCWTNSFWIWYLFTQAYAILNGKYTCFPIQQCRQDAHLMGSHVLWTVSETSVCQCNSLPPDLHCRVFKHQLKTFLFS